MQSQKTPHQKIDSYWVMKSLGDTSVHTVQPSDPQERQYPCHICFVFLLLRLDIGWKYLLVLAEFKLNLSQAARQVIYFNTHVDTSNQQVKTTIFSTGLQC